MGSTNTNNWLSFPDLSSSQASVSHHHHHHQFSLGLVNDGMDNINPFQNQEWNLINAHGGHEVPKVADFLGVSKSSMEDQTDIVPYNDPISSANNNNNNINNDSDYLFQNNGLAQVVHQSSVISGASRAYHEYQENPRNLQALTLSMGTTGKDSSSCADSSTDNISATSDNTMVEATPRRTLDTFGQRTSIYRGVTRHRWTGRYEAHLWDNSCRREGQSRKGRQVYLGGYDKEEKAARSYDLAALKYWGTSTTTNFPITNYEKELEEMKHMTRQEFVASIRRKSSGFSRGASMYRGVTRHHQHGRWQARIGRVAGNKDLYLGTFSTEEEAAEAYDIAAIKFRGLNAVTNFDMNRYDVKSILESNSLPIGGGAAKRLKEAQALESSRKRDEMMALTAASPFHYGSSSSTASNNNSISSPTTRLQGYPMMSQHAYDHSPNPNQYHNTFLSLQNSHSDNIDPSFHQNYIQTQLQLQQQFGGYNTGYSHAPGGNFLQGIMDNSAYGSGYSLGMSPATNNSSGGGSEHQELAVVKVDYDVPSETGYWAGSGSGSNAGVFSMWNMTDHQ